MRGRPATTLLVLGDPLELGSRSVRARSAWVAVPGPGLPLVGPRPFRPGTERRWPNWPRLAGRAKCWTWRARCPLDDLGRRRWAERLRIRAAGSAATRGLRNGRLHPDCRHSARVPVLEPRCLRSLRCPGYDGPRRDDAQMGWPSKRQLRRFWRPFRSSPASLWWGWPPGSSPVRRASLPGAGAFLTQLRWSWLALGGLAELGSFLALATVQRLLLRAGEIRTPAPTG